MLLAGMPSHGHWVYVVPSTSLLGIPSQESVWLATLPARCVPKGETRAIFSSLPALGLPGFLAHLHTSAEIHVSSGPPSTPLAVRGNFWPAGTLRERDERGGRLRTGSAGYMGRKAVSVLGWGWRGDTVPVSLLGLTQVNNQVICGDAGLL